MCASGRSSRRCPARATTCWWFAPPLCSRLLPPRLSRAAAADPETSDPSRKLPSRSGNFRSTPRAPRRRCARSGPPAARYSWGSQKGYSKGYSHCAPSAPWHRAALVRPERSLAARARHSAAEGVRRNTHGPPRKRPPAVRAPCGRGAGQHGHVAETRAPREGVGVDAGARARELGVQPEVNIYMQPTKYICSRLYVYIYI